MFGRAQPAGTSREKAEVCKLSPRGSVGRGGGSVCGLCQGAGEYFPVSAKAATLGGSSSAAQPGTRLSLHPHPTRTPTHPGRRHPSLSALYLQHQREKPGAQAQCEPPQSGAGWGGEGAGAAAPSRPAKWQERQISLISGQLWCTRTPGSRPLPFSPRSLEKASFFLYSAVRTGAFIPLRGNMVQCARSPPRLC